MATSETSPKSGPVNPNMQHSGWTVYVTPYVAPVHGSVGLDERPEKFNEKDFKRWKQKMLFYLTTLNLARFLQEDAPDLGDNPDRQTVAAVYAWKHSDFLCKNYILNGLDNALYNVHIPMVNAKALWESLERKYNKGMVLGESFQVAALIKKLPPTWKDFKNYLKHKRKEMKLEDLIVRLRIEEDNSHSEKKAGNYHQEAKANVVEQGTEKGYIIVCLYVDDMLIIGGNNEFIKATKKMLISKFEMKDTGVADVILGLCGGGSIELMWQWCGDAGDIMVENGIYGSLMHWSLKDKSGFSIGW
ncbi:hypothetical protein RJ639_023085 [Escallonia herrerae]|uniref:Reverse transcriptase Ty1/copia-type domain-containing protein n=1 Tax=Escallonia herrerae TaxID=1293975 RepID=A0AA89AE62_9ASTE|nr:hypothetical protein RJ639_023085 [Escallonia herrerae]